MDASGTRYRLPPELQGTSAHSRAARESWEEMRRAGDLSAEAQARYGRHSPDARRARHLARVAQERMLATLGYELEEVVAQMSPYTNRGLNSIASQL